MARTAEECCRSVRRDDDCRGPPIVGGAAFEHGPPAHLIQSNALTPSRGGAAVRPHQSRLVCNAQGTGRSTGRNNGWAEIRGGDDTRALIVGSARCGGRPTLEAAPSPTAVEGLTGTPSRV